MWITTSETSYSSFVWFAKTLLNLKLDSLSRVLTVYYSKPVA